MKDFHPFRGDRFADWTGQDLKGNNDLLMLTQPSIVCEVYSKFIAAGSDIIETNTFNAITISQKDYGLGHLVPELNLAAARLPREAAPRGCFACADGRGLCETALESHKNLFEKQSFDG